jgi:hypothetical protein
MHSNFDKQREQVRRDPEDRHAHTEEEKREKSLDKTLADSFPTSDPPSTSPDLAEASEREYSDESRRELLMGLQAGSWAAISLEDHQLVGAGATRDEAEKAARDAGVPNVELVEVPADSDAPFQAA